MIIASTLLAIENIIPYLVVAGVIVFIAMRLLLRVSERKK
jgi:hypothetical protein